MIHLRLRTEYSFRDAFGRVPVVLERVKAIGAGAAAAITDAGTWGHVQFYKEALKAGVRPILGAEIAVVDDVRERAAKVRGSRWAFLARNEQGLKELYALVTRANQHFYNEPRVDYDMVNDASKNLIRIVGADSDLTRIKNTPFTFLGLYPGEHIWNRSAKSARGFSTVVAADNRFPRPEDRAAYEIHAGMGVVARIAAAHIPDEYELRELIPVAEDEDILNTERIAAQCDVKLPKAKMVHFEGPQPLNVLCLRGAAERGLPIRGNQLADPVYQARLERELTMIAEKKFEDYFYVIGDMVRYAKLHMLVGPARGSSAGSLVCYLLGITDVDPLKFGLMFERFIDITRADLPDVDIDFQDDKRELVFDYLRERYGPQRVGRLGTVMRYKAKSCIGDVAKALRVPDGDVKDVKDSIIDRSTGDARAQFAVMDAFEGLDIGKALLAKYPQMRIAADLEGHARNPGKHAAGVVLTEHPVQWYTAISRDDVAMVDKKDAESLNMLKIDVLGLRTLSVIQDTLDHIGKTRDWLLALPLEDVESFEILNQEKYSAIFQFEGYALQSLTRQMKVHEFNDIVIITTLARPGPLHCGAATEFIQRKTGAAPVSFLHPLAEPFTSETYGSIIYQEQVMACGRAIGNLSWEDVSELRKAMSKSLGEEFFNRYWVKFAEGAAANAIQPREARQIWDKMCTFGSWAFNKSHAVSYGLLSYWCCYLKAHYPLEWAAANLRNESDQEKSIKLLRELVKEGYEYLPVDPAKSTDNWEVVEGRLLGGLTNIKGLGPAKAKIVIEKRAAGKPMPPGIAKMLADPVTPYDDIFQGERLYGEIYRNPKAFNIVSGGVTYVRDIGDPGDYVFIARIKEKNLRDLNEYGNLVKRGGRKVTRDALFLNILLEDDTGSIIAQVGRFDYKDLGKPLVEEGKIGEWYLWKGHIRNDGWRMLNIQKWRRLDPGGVASSAFILQQVG